VLFYLERAPATNSNTLPILTNSKRTSCDQLRTSQDGYADMMLLASQDPMQRCVWLFNPSQIWSCIFLQRERVLGGEQGE